MRAQKNPGDNPEDTRNECRKFSLKLHLHTLLGQLKIRADAKTILDWTSVHT